MAWPTYYRSRYRPMPGKAGWSTRHMIAEQPDSVIELIEEKRRGRMADKLHKLHSAEMQEEESGWESSSTVSVDIEKVSEDLSDGAQQPPASEEEDNGIRRLAGQMENQRLQGACGNTCWLKEFFNIPKTSVEPEEPTPQTSGGSSSSIYGTVKPWLKGLPGVLTTLLERKDPAEPVSANMSPLLYKALDTSTIRILEVLPGSSSDPIRCLLDSVRLPKEGDVEATASMIHYEALSYVWGPPEPAQSIYIATCDDPDTSFPVKITPNLHSALSHLRFADKSRFLWADAVCINQEDIAEKNDQVSRMMTIYEQADRVIVWLGSDYEDEQVAMHGINLLNDAQRRDQLFERQHEPTCMAMLTRLYNALVRLYERPWFGRVWIWQEVMVARDLVVCCGDAKTSWKALKRAMRRLPKVQKLLQMHDICNLPTLSTMRVSLIRMLKHRWIFGESLLDVISKDRDTVYELHSGGPLELMFVSKMLQSTDARDKVYAFLGLGRVPARSETSNSQKQGDEDAKSDNASDEEFVDAQSEIIDESEPHVKIDYTMPVPKVYEQFAIYMINKYRTLDVLCVLNTYRTDRHARYPSWVPDWETEPGIEFDPLSNFDYLDMHYSAAGDSLAELQNLERFQGDGILFAKGLYVDRIVALLDYTTNTYGLSHIHRVLAQYGTEDGGYGDNIEAELEKGCREDPEVFQRFKKNDKHSRRCCRTATGRLLLVPSWTGEDGQLWILFGGRLPFIVNPIYGVSLHKSHESPAVACFSVVGPCYAPDLVSGRFFDHQLGARDTGKYGKNNDDVDRSEVEELALF